MKYYLYDHLGIYTESVDIDTQKPLPGRGSLIAPPELTPPQVARVVAGGWEVLPERPEPAPVNQFQKDQSRYTKRAAVKDELLAYMAADNMSRVRSEVWTVADLTSLLDDPAVVAANSLMGTLSFELAAQQIQAATTPLLTPEIKADWVSHLESHYYLEG